MARQRFSLDETMNDAKQGIEEAKKETPQPVVQPQPEATPEEAGEGTEEKAAPANTVQPENGGVGKGSAPQRTVNPKIIRLQKKVVRSENRVSRGIFFDEELVDKLEQMKKVINKSREKATKETFVSLIDLVNIATREFVEKYYDDVVGE